MALLVGDSRWRHEHMNIVRGLEFGRRPQVAGITSPRGNVVVFDDPVSEVIGLLCEGRFRMRK